MKKLILNADDYGATDFIDNGIITGIEEGVVNSVSVLVNFPDSRKRVLENLLPLQEKYDFKIGLHLCITAGYSGLKASSITLRGSREFPFLKNIILGAIQKDDLIEEIKYQIEELGSMLGGVQNIDHINHHQGIFYMDSFLFNCFMEVLESYKVTHNKTFNLRSPLTWSKSGLKYYDYSLYKPHIQIVRRGIRNAAGVSFFRQGRIKTILRLSAGSMLAFVNQIENRIKDYSNDHSFCFVDQYYGQANEHNLKMIIEHLPNDNRVIEFMMHLGKLKDSNTKYDYAKGINSGYYPGRKKELDVFLANKHLLEKVKIVNHGNKE